MFLSSTVLWYEWQIGVNRFDATHEIYRFECSGHFGLDVFGAWIDHERNLSCSLFNSEANYSWLPWKYTNRNMFYLFK
jgi:hypothetical protein